MRAVMRKFLLTIFCLCSFQNAVVAAEPQLLLGAPRGPAHDTAIALAMELSETLKRPVIIKAFDDEATMYIWLDRYRMVDFALTSRSDLAPGQLHRLGSVPVVGGATSVELISHGGVARDVLLKVREMLAGESRGSVAEAASSEKNSTEILTPEAADLSADAVAEAASVVKKDNAETAPAAQSLPDADGIKSFLSHLDPGQDPPERAPVEKESAEFGPVVASETAPPVSADVVAVDPAVSEEQADADNVTGLLSYWGLTENAPEGEEPPLAVEGDALTSGDLLSEPGNQEVLAPEPVAVMPPPKDSTADPAAAEEQSGIEAMLSHWGLSAEDASESEKTPAEEAQPQLHESLVTSDPVETAEETPGKQSSWGGVGDLLNHWGLATEEVAETALGQGDSVATVVMNAPQPRSFKDPAKTVVPEPVPVAAPPGPLVVHLVPMTRVMLPERVENRLLEEFSRLLLQQDLDEKVEFVELDKPLSQIEPSWLDQHHSLAGEIFGYKEKTGRLSTTLRLRGRLYYRSPTQAASFWQKEVPVKVSFDPDASSLEEAQDQLVVELAAVLIEAFLAEISPE